MFGLHPIDVIIVVGYLLVMLGIGFYLQKRMKTESLLNSRRRERRLRLSG